MKGAVLALALVALVGGCSSKTDPNETNFGAAIKAYLQKHGSLCLGTESWPVELAESEGRITGIRGEPSERVRLEALVSQGLVARTEVDKPVVSFMGAPTGRTQRFTRYELTQKGKQYLKPRDSEGIQEGKMPGALCYGHMALDKVIKWEGPMKLGDYQEALVKYHYRVENLAAWAKSEEVQAAFPELKERIAAAGTAPQSHVVQLTSVGWEVRGIDRD